MDKKTEAQLSLVIHKAHLESGGVETHIKVYVRVHTFKKKFFFIKIWFIYNLQIHPIVSIHLVIFFFK